MTVIHKHHIKPKHAGGSNDHSNLIQLTIEEHAEAHRKLWIELGDENDRIAWLALSGQITGAEARIAAHKLKMTGRKLDSEHRNKVIKTLRNGSGSENTMFGKFGKDNPHFGMKRSPEAKKNISTGNTGTKRTLSAETRIKKAEIARKNSKLRSEKHKQSLPDMSDAQQLYDSGMSYKELAKHYGVGTWTIQSLKLKTRSYSDAGKVRFEKSPVSDETKLKMSAAMMGNHNRAGI